MQIDSKHNQGKQKTFDPSFLRDKYKEERDKRLRPDGNDQYQEVKGDFSYFIEDPYVENEIKRDPLEDEVEVVIIGGGFGGMLAGARLRESGINDFRIIEKGGDFGGTWYWNRYPGASCDIESYIYFPLLEEINFMPKEKYTNAPETLEYCKLMAEKFKLYENSCMQTEVTSAEWDESISKWIILTNRQDKIKARYLVNSNGPLNRPKLPAIKGVHDFKGHTFHTSRWDYGYTGGSSSGNLTSLKGKKVAVIGTGATAVQCVPHLGETAEHLYVFQRTPSSIDLRNNTKTDSEWALNLKPGWHEKRRNNFESLLAGVYQKEDLVNDGWTDLFKIFFGAFRKIRPSNYKMATWAVSSVFSSDLYRLGFEGYMRNKFMNFVGHDNLMKEMEMADFEKMEKIRARADAVIEDPKTAESLKPYYRQLCKRPCFHDEYLQTFNKPNVTLVDTKGRGVNQITQKGIIFEGKEYEVDCIIFATGFEVGTAYTRRSGYEIYGKEKQSLAEKWKDGLSTFHGMHTRGFPNCFFFGPQHSAFTANFTYSLDQQSIHLAYILKKASDMGITRIEASQDAEEGWIKTIVEKARLTQDFQEKCTPGYYNNEGQPNPLAQNTFYGGGPIEFFSLMDKWRSKGNLQGLELKN